MSRQRIVVATADIVGGRMAGPAIRAWHIATALADEHDVRLVTTADALVTSDRFPVIRAGDAELRSLIEWCDVFVFQGWMLAGRPFLASSDKVLVADVYDPLLLEQLEQGRDHGDEAWRDGVARARDVLNEQLLRADFLTCASEKQRDFWLGHLAALGRLNTRTYEADRTLRNLLDVVPFGVEDHPPVRTGPGARGTIPGITHDDELVLWGGGLYSWFDPSTLIHAIDGLRARRPRVRLLFMGMRHPNPEIPMMAAAIEAKRLAEELGLTGTHVFFNEEWVPYGDRQNYLLDADIGVTTHHDHLETAYSFRTRVLDYLWAGLPVLTTSGDAISELVEQRGIGLAVAPGDVAAVENALHRLLDDVELRANAAAAARTLGEELRWSAALEPLLAFCRAPHRAADLSDPQLGPALALACRAHSEHRAAPRRGVRGLVRRLLPSGERSARSGSAASEQTPWSPDA